MSADNKARMKSFYEEVVQNGNFEALDELVAPQFVDHNPSPGQAQGAAGLKELFTAMRAAVSGLRVSVEQVVAEGDKVAAHVAVRGKHTGEFMGLPPSGREVVIRVSDIVRIENGKAVERWGVEDMSGFLPQA